MTRPHILETAPDDLAAWLASARQPRFRAAQILDWLYRRHADSFDAMSDLPRDLRSRLKDAFDFSIPREINRLVSANAAAGKLLLELGDAEQIECVWMNDRGRSTFCISSQAGCPLGCRFCATGAAGFARNLRTAEILAQVSALARVTGQLRNVVFMGMGEPLLNLDAVLPALEALADPRRFGLSPRHITVSTAGIAAGIRALAQAQVHPNLALSLNSPFDDKRSELMPVNRTQPLDGVLDACADYAAVTGRRILIEYVLLTGVNTGQGDAAAVARIAAQLGALVNLIPVNPVPETCFRRPTTVEIAAFRSALESKGVRVTQRFRRGRDISAACGQLRATRPRGPATRHA